MRKPLLQVENLKTSFSSQRKKIKAVRGVSFDLYPGESLGIVGESGCGKSVMARSLTKLILESSGKIEEGKVLYKGENLLLKNKKELQKIRGKEISMIFQDPMTSLNPTMRIGRQISEGLRRHHPEIPRREAYRKVIKLLKQVGIHQAETRYDQYPHELSGGMRQRVMIATAIIAASSPSILIADEPTTALDVTIQAQILELLKGIQEEKMMSIILITHDLSIVAGFCDRILVMYAGKIVESGSIEQLFVAPKHPYTKRLLKSIPRLDSLPQHQLYSIHGSPPDLSTKIQGCGFRERCPHAMHICRDGPSPSFSVGENHFVNCWLYDPRVKKREK